MMKEYYCVVTFEITQHALLFEKELKEHNLGVKLMPAPRELSTSCGTAALVICEDKDEIKNLCEKKSIPINEFHKLEVTKKDSWFTRRIIK